MPEEFQPLMILASLPASYMAIVQMLGSQAGKLDMAHVTSTVLDEDARRRENGSQENQALVSHRGRQPRNSARNDLSRVQCYNCEKMGHFSHECPNQPKQGKATRHKPKPLGEIRSTQRLEKVHSDVCGPMQTAFNSGKKYMVTFVDDYSRSCAVHFMAHNTKATPLRCFRSFMRRLPVRVENE